MMKRPIHWTLGTATALVIAVFTATAQEQDAEPGQTPDFEPPVMTDGFIGGAEPFDLEEVLAAEPDGSVEPAASSLSRVVPKSDLQVRLSYAPLVRQAAPAVVNIYTKRVVEERRNTLFDDPFFRRFFGDRGSRSAPRQRVQGSLGSGVIIGPDGVIVTNNHVIAGADEITVALADRREFDAEIVAADDRTDLAVLRIETDGEALPFLEYADSDAIEVGDLVLAIGNPFGVGQTVTGGIVSANARTAAGISDYQFFIQTDAAVNPGNSGGALLGMDGRLIGVNTAIFSRSGGNNGIGFAIPANMVKTVVSAALGEGRITRPWLGAAGQGVTSELAESLGRDRPGGVLVDDVYADGPADRGGIEPGDVILAIDGKEVLDPQSMRFRLATAIDSNFVPFTVMRGGETFELLIGLEMPPEDPPRNTTLLEGRHPFQGVTVANLSPAYADELGLTTMDRGVIVTKIERRSPAARRQFVRPGDIILALNDQPINLVADFGAALVEPQEDYVYRLRRRQRGQVREFECGIIGGRSFYCR